MYIQIPPSGVIPEGTLRDLVDGIGSNYEYQYVFCNKTDVLHREFKDKEEFIKQYLQDIQESCNFMAMKFDIPLCQVTKYNGNVFGFYRYMADRREIDIPKGWEENKAYLEMLLKHLFGKNNLAMFIGRHFFTTYCTVGEKSAGEYECDFCDKRFKEAKDVYLIHDKSMSIFCKNCWNIATEGE